MKKEIKNKEKKQRKNRNYTFIISLAIIIVCLLIVFSFIDVFEKNNIKQDKTEDEDKTDKEGFLNTLYNFWGGFLDVFGMGEEIRILGEEEDYPNFFLDVGAEGDDDAGNSIYLNVTNGTSGRLDDNGVTYRYINMSKSLNFYVNTSSLGFLAENGVPYKDAIIEIGYKDVVSEKGCSSFSSYSGNCRAYLATRIDYGWSQQYHAMNGIGGVNDSKWNKTVMFFENTPWQVLRSINGVFNFRIYLPNQTYYANLPIDYINFRFVSKETLDELRNQDRLKRGLIRVEYNETNTINAADYYGKKYVIYKRNYLEKTYPQTIPNSSEILELGDKLKTFEISANYEPLTFSIYAFEDLNNIKVSVSDLISGNNKITQDNIKIEKVVYLDKRWGSGWSSAYGINPAYLKSFDEIDINKNNTQQIWLTIYVPENSQEGVYTGNITINGDNIEPSKIPIELEVYNINIESPDSTPYIYSSPYTSLYSNPRNVSVLDMAEHGVNPLLYPNIKMNFTDDTINFSNTEFENLSRLGMLPKKVMIGSFGNWKDLWKKACGGTADYCDKPCADFDSNFTKLVKYYINYLEENYGVTPVFSFEDEPGVDVERRKISNCLNKLVKEAGAETWVTYYSTGEVDLRGLFVKILDDDSTIQKGDYAEYSLTFNKEDAPEIFNVTMNDDWAYISSNAHFYKELWINGDIVFNESNSKDNSADNFYVNFSEYENPITITMRLVADRVMAANQGYDSAYTVLPDNLTWLDLDWQFSKNRGVTVNQTNKNPYLGPMDPYLDNRVYAMRYVSQEEITKTKQSNDKFNYYTTYPATTPIITYNRFFNGIYASALNTTGVWVYAYGSWGAQPYDDMDSYSKNSPTNPTGLRGQATYQLIFLSWEPKVYDTLIYESLREGIEDSKIIATLEKAIKEHPGAKADEANAYLENLYSGINKTSSSYYTPAYNYNNLNVYNEKYNLNSTILKDLSGDNRNYDAFDEMRKTMIDYIVELSPQACTDCNQGSPGNGGDSGGLIPRLGNITNNTLITLPRDEDENLTSAGNETPLAPQNRVTSGFVGFVINKWIWFIIGGIGLLVLIILIIIFVNKKRENYKYARLEETKYHAKNRIHEFRARGYSDEEIKRRFLEKGWNDKFLERIFDEIR